MSIAFLLWTLAVSTLILGVAGAAAAALRHLGRPERGLWMIALAATAALPFLPAAVPAEDAAEITGISIAVPLAQVMAAASASLPAPARVSIPWIPILWSLASAITVLVLLGGAWSLARRRETWPRRRVEGDLLRVSEDFGPAVVGWVEPEVVLPTWAVDLESRQRRMILRHENEHRWARDPQLLALGVLLLAAAPWNPIAWLHFRGLRRAIEFDCDARVLSGGASPRAYGRLLLSVQLDRGRGALFAPSLREPASFLERRLQTMTLRDRPVARLRVLGLTLVAASLTVVACEAPRPTEAEAPMADATAPSVAAIEAVQVAPLVEAEYEEAPADRTVVLVQETGAVLIDRGGMAQMVTAAQVRGVAEALLEQFPGDPFFVSVETDANAGDVLEVQEALKLAGVDKVGVLHVDDPASPDTELVFEESEARSVQTVVVGSEWTPSAGDLELHLEEQRSGYFPAPEVEVVNGRYRFEAESVNWSTSVDSDMDAPLVYVDGVRISPASREEVLAKVKPQDIERIEVMRGDEAAERFGDAAANGVLQIFTKKN